MLCMKIKLKKQINGRFGFTLPKGSIYEAIKVEGNRYIVELEGTVSIVLDGNDVNVLRENKFNLNKIVSVGDRVANTSFGGYTCIYMSYFIDAYHVSVYSNLFDFEGLVAMEEILRADNEYYTDSDYKNIRLMLVAMFYEICRRENEGENILSE